MATIRDSYTILIIKYGRKNPLPRPKLRWEDSILILLSYESCCVSILVRIKVSHHNKIKQDRRYCIYIRFIISISIATCFDSY
jgi:hypothetical protein